MAPGKVPARDALIDAALAQLEEKGALAGLNLTEVAEAAGVMPANIYHLFGSRQGLLREALRREADRLVEPFVSAPFDGFVERRLLLFDAIAALPVLRLTALLALDDDPDYEPVPFLEGARRRFQEQIEAGALPVDVDVDATHLLTIAAAIASSIYLEPAARQLGVAPDELRGRLRAAYARMVSGLVVDGGPQAAADDEPGAAPVQEAAEPPPATRPMHDPDPDLASPTD